MPPLQAQCRYRATEPSAPHSKTVAGKPSTDLLEAHARKKAMTL